MKTYSVKSNATRAARKAYPNGDFVVYPADNGEWAFGPEGADVVEKMLAAQARHVQKKARHAENARQGTQALHDLSLHATFERAYDFFNEKLFAGLLPACIILVHRKKNARGYFWAERWTNRESGEGRHEIAMNPDTFGIRSDADILSTLVHEMTHLEQQAFGKPAKNGYHDKAWVKLMDAVGLMPYASTGPEPDVDENGQWIRPKKDTGTKVTHVIVPGGPFEKACEELLATGLHINWRSCEQSPAEKAIAKKKRDSKTKFTCPECGLNAWAKPDAVIGCWECGVEMEDEA